MQDDLLLFVHSLLRYGVLLSVALAGLMHLHGSLRQRPILIGERKLSIIAVILCHSQLVIGLLLYLMNFSTYSQMGGEVGRFWKMEHIGVMVIAIALVTVSAAFHPSGPRTNASNRNGWPSSTSSPWH